MERPDRPSSTLRVWLTAVRPFAYTASVLTVVLGAAEIEAVYSQGVRTPRRIVALLLLAVVRPGEEIFWRGYVQRRLTAELGGSGFALSILAYTGVHLATANLTLILAALVFGVFWALLYRLFGSIWINIVSHALWAAAIFVWWPMR